MELQNGRPAGADRRQPREARVYDYLDGLGIEYQRVDHAPAQTMEDCKAIDEVLGTAMCKNLFLCNRQKTNFYLLLMPADKPFKTKELSAQINAARLSFASDRLLVDEDLFSDEFIGCHPCVNTSSLRLRTDDVFGKYLKSTGHGMTKVKLIGE